MTSDTSNTVIEDEDMDEALADRINQEAVQLAAAVDDSLHGNEPALESSDHPMICEKIDLCDYALGESQCLI